MLTTDELCYSQQRECSWVSTNFSLNDQTILPTQISPNNYYENILHYFSSHIKLKSTEVPKSNSTHCVSTYVHTILYHHDEQAQPGKYLAR